MKSSLIASQVNHCSLLKNFVVLFFITLSVVLGACSSAKTTKVPTVAAETSTAKPAYPEYAVVNAASLTIPDDGSSSINPQYIISITVGGETFGDVVIELFPHLAPKHCANFDSLVKVGFYNGTKFHRIVPGFVIQGGDPNSKSKPKDTWGKGDPSQRKIPAEFNPTLHRRGIISAARRGNDVNSATSQFFICLDDASALDNQYTAYGQVLSGMEVVDKVAAMSCDEKEKPLEVVSMQIKPK